MALSTFRCASKRQPLNNLPRPALLLRRCGEFPGGGTFLDPLFAKLHSFDPYSSIGVGDDEIAVRDLNDRRVTVLIPAFACGEVFLSIGVCIASLEVTDSSPGEAFIFRKRYAERHARRGSSDAWSFGATVVVESDDHMA